MQNLFTTQIGDPQNKRRKRGNANTRGTLPLTLVQAKAPINATEQRRTRLSNSVRKLCLRLAYEALDPQRTGNVAAQTYKDIADELEHLIKNGQTEQDRDTQRFIVEHGQEKYDCINQLEQKALKNAQDLDATSEEEEEAEDDGEDEGSDLEGFIVASDVESEEEPQQTIGICVNDEEEHEPPCEPFHDEEGTHLSEQD